MKRTYTAVTAFYCIKKKRPVSTILYRLTSFVKYYQNGACPIARTYRTITRAGAEPPPFTERFFRKGPASRRCHPFTSFRAGSERSEGPARCRREILRCAQDDRLWRPARFKKPTGERQAPSWSRRGGSPALDWIGILNGELAVAHNNQTINLDGAFAGNDIDVNFRAPVRSSKFRVRIAEGHVQSWHLFVLQEVAA